ncbi:MAG: AAA family ATPase [Chitinispirillaceae bacterium]|nr:AAA family ATPase [Chitinispirillaceae bacterium]
MQLTTVTLFNFQCFGSTPTEITLKDISFLIGPNGSGKTAALLALCRMFSFDPKQRHLRRSDFNVPYNEEPLEAKRELWIEAEFSLPEINNTGTDQPTVPPQFSHMRLQDGAEIPTVRIRLSGKMDVDGDIEEEVVYVLSVDHQNQPVDKQPLPALDRKSIQVHYLPAKRDPADHIAYSANALLGRLLRSANWSEDRKNIQELTEQVSQTLEENIAISTFGTHLTEQWSHFHKGAFFTNPSISFATTEIETLLRHMSISFSPGHDESYIDFSRLSDGQKSLLYLSLVLTAQQISRELIKATGQETGFDPDKLRPPTFTIIIIEEPENSLAPYYLGRIFSSLQKMIDGMSDSQALIATHSPQILRRVEPENICYLRLDEQRQSKVKTILMPDKATDAHKFVREAVQAFPEVYFARLVILGEGDSEEIVLPRILRSKGIPVDENGICIAPLGGRHVNHFWRLLSGLDIPYITLLDLDLARHRGGWGRIKVANNYLKKFHPKKALPSNHFIPEWNNEKHKVREYDNYFEHLQGSDVFFSSPLDLDFSMIKAFPKAYKIKVSDVVSPNEDAIKSVLGKGYHGVEQYSADEQKLFESYVKLFKNGSKPAAHIGALSSLSDEKLLADMPTELEQLAEKAKEKLEGLHE